ncbi:MAG TPA: serine/threonine-protein kinase, partial [Kofleriaceae bacterium]|nr:serine/threonine-protein kinase [Kofleriaceae bacterium]
QSPGSGGGGEKRRSVHTGDVLGRYELVEEIGEGGMATVYRARDRELRREVAIKVLFPHLARRTDVVRRFHREARAAAGLEHANILRVYDVGGAEGTDPPYIVMELIRGHSLLGEVERRGAMLAELAACVGALLADALAVAHEAGIIHRDVKPANVMIAPGGRVLLTDFGVARLETEDTSLVTKTGSVLGTPAYMSPEQASGDTATAKSDLYSLGATLYQLSTGLLPYSGSPAKVMSAIASGHFVAPVRRSAAVGPDLSRVIERLMESEPSARPASARAIATELRELAATAGFGEPSDELAAYFEDPDAFVQTKRPAVLTALVAAGKRALAESKLPRAMALADRASSIAPDDPAVKTLVEAVTAGGRASQRRKVALAAAAVIVLGGGGTLAMTLAAGGSHEAPRDAALAADATVADAIAIVEPDAPRVTYVDAALAADAAERVDAGRPRRVDAAVAIDAPPIDAAPSLFAPDASVAIDAAATVGDGTLIVQNDTWCEVSVDGLPQGRMTKRKVLRLPEGHHTISCAQPGINPGWTREVDVVAAKTFAVSGTMLQTVAVTVAIRGTEVQINETHYPRGSVIQLRPGRYRAVVKDGAGGWLDIPNVGRCTLHEAGAGLVCDP